MCAEHKIPKVDSLHKQYGLVNIDGVTINSVSIPSYPSKYQVDFNYNGRQHIVKFGHRDYAQFNDRWQAYAALNHGDETRKINFLNRHTSKGKSPRGNDPRSAIFWSIRVLW